METYKMNQRFIIIYFILRIVAANYSELSRQSYSGLANGNTLTRFYTSLHTKMSIINQKVNLPP